MSDDGEEWQCTRYYDTLEMKCRSPTDEEEDERMQEEVAKWNKKAAALVHPITTYSTQLEEVQAKIQAIRKKDKRRLDVSLLTEKQKIQEKYNMYRSFRNTSQDLAHAYAQIVYERHRCRDERKWCRDEQLNLKELHEAIHKMQKGVVAERLALPVTINRFEQHCGEMDPCQEPYISFRALSPSEGQEGENLPTTYLTGADLPSVEPECPASLKSSSPLLATSPPPPP